MIRLAGNTTEVYTSQTFSHGVYTTGSAAYYLSHSLSREPDSVEMYRYNPTEGLWSSQRDFWQATNGYNYGMDVSWDQISDGVVGVRVFRISSISVDIRFKCMVFN